MGAIGVSLLCSAAHAGRVRTIYASDRTMQPVFLTMGRSTVLRFDEKPKSAVIGNQNYFSLEYIGNDITIQPQGVAGTNLFVYTEFQTYGLILQVGGQAQYDDLVQVRFRPGYVNVSDRTPKKRYLVSDMTIGKRLEINGVLRLNLPRAIQSIAQGVWIFEAVLENLSKENLAASDMQISAAAHDRSQPFTKAVCEKDALASGEKTQCRVIVRTERIDGAEIIVRHQGKEQKLILPRRSFR